MYSILYIINSMRCQENIKIMFYFNGGTRYVQGKLNMIVLR